MNAENAGDIWGGGNTSASDTNPLATTWSGDNPTPFAGTQDFHLLVVDCFDYEELKTKGANAKRMWTTLMSAPHRGKQKFSEVAAALARNGSVYYGGTNSGLQVFTDASARVEIGPLKVIDDDERGEFNRE